MSRVTVSANGPSSWIRISSNAAKLGPTLCVGTPSGNWGGASVAVEYTPDNTAEQPIVAPVTLDGAPIVFNSNIVRPLENVAGFIRINVSNYNAQPITAQVT